jgi:hypothetical protein
MARSPSVKSLIKDLEPDELREVIVELSKLNPKNKQFLRLYLQSSDAVDVDAVTEEAREKIYAHFYGNSRARYPKIELAKARKTVREYSKVLKEYPGQIAELKLYYVEVGTKLANEFGGINGSFYSSLESMFGSFCDYIEKNPAYYKQFRDRVNKLQSASKGNGWGYEDAIEDLASELEETIISDENM